MSFLQNVVSIIHEKETMNAKKKMEKIVSETKELQEKVKDIIDANYVNFLTNTYNHDKVFREGVQLEDEVNTLLSNIKDGSMLEVGAANDNLQKYQSELDEALLGFKISTKLMKINNLFQIIEQCHSSNDYLKLIDILGKIHALINDPGDSILPKMECYENMKIKYQVEYEQVLYNLNQKFETLVKFIEKPFQNTTSITIKITKDEDQLHDIVTALMNTKYNPRKMCTFLIENVFEPIITRPVSLKINEKDEDFVILQLSYSIKPINSDLRPHYKTIFKNIMETFTCLGYMNILISENKCIFTIIADHIKEKFCRLLINECLSFSLPDTIEEMNDSTLVQDINEFNKFLTNMYFVDQDHNESLDLYAEKIEILFRNKFCSSVLNNAVEIMRKDLHDMLLIGENESTASNSPAIFPSCMISKSVIELKNLLDKILLETNGIKEDELSDKLMVTISYILDRYMIEVPEYHEKLLVKIPQQTALFHNNCMYLAFWITKNAIKTSNNENFISIAKSLQLKGTECFSNQLKNQRTQILEILQGFDLSGQLTELGIEPQKVVRQCLRQFDLLKNVWQTVLPDSIYKKSIGNLLSDFCSEIIKRIFILEDITAIIGAGLVNILDVIIEKAPSLFKDNLDVNLNVKSWSKLVQLQMILGASLIQITEHWADGKGPLTLNFKADEIKHLIRALFQNTDRRANALSLII